MATTSFSLPTTNGVDSISGLDLNSLIKNLVGIEQSKVTRVENEKARDQVKIQAYSQIRSLLEDIRTKVDALSEPTSFDLFSSSSTKADAVTISGSSGAVDGQYEVKVYQLAAHEKMIGADNRITSQTATLADQGIGVGDISIGGVRITVDANDTIQDLRAKINAAVDSKGNHLPVTATVIKSSASNYRIVLTAKSTGDEGVDYKDLTGSTLQNLGIITTADGEKGSVAQQIQSSDDIASAWNSLAAGSVVHLEGTDHNGLAVSLSFVKSAGTTVNDFLKKVSTAFHDTVGAAVDGSGRLTMTDKTLGGSELALSELTFGGTAYSVGIVQGGTEGAGVLTAGKNAFAGIDDMMVTSSDNTISGFDAGSTFQLHAVTGDTGVTVALARDADAIEQKFTDLLNAFNKLTDYARQATKMADPGVAGSTDGTLAGDMTVTSIVERVRQSFSQKYNLFGGSRGSFTMIGLKTDSRTGTLSVDSATFKKSLATDLDAVKRLFITSGSSPENQNISLGLQTKDTKSGVYELQEPDPQHVQIRLKGTSQWITSGARIGDVVNFSTGPVKGLSIAMPQGSGSGGVTFVFQKGLSTVIGEAIKSMTTSDDGMVTLREKTLSARMADADERILDLQDRVESYRVRLLNQFSQMESTLASLKQQNSRIAQYLGY